MEGLFRAVRQNDLNTSSNSEVHMLQTFGSLGKYFFPPAFLLHHSLSNLTAGLSEKYHGAWGTFGLTEKNSSQVEKFHTAHACTFTSADPELCQKKKLHIIFSNLQELVSNATSSKLYTGLN